MIKEFINRRNIAFKLLVAFLVILVLFSFHGSLAFAEEVHDNPEIPVEPVVVYPTSGSTSGYFNGPYSSTATFSLSSGTYYVIYSYSNDYSQTGTLQITNGDGTLVASRSLIADGSPHNTTSFSLSAGTYYFKIVSGTVITNNYYGYTLNK